MTQDRDLVLLEQIEKNPDATQASLASQIGVAVGTVNWHLKRLIEKGYVKLAERRIKESLTEFKPPKLVLTSEKD